MFCFANYLPRTTVFRWEVSVESGVCNSMEFSLETDSHLLWETCLAIEFNWWTMRFLFFTQQPGSITANYNYQNAFFLYFRGFCFFVCVCGACSNWIICIISVSWYWKIHVGFIVSDREFFGVTFWSEEYGKLTSLRFTCCLCLDLAINSYNEGVFETRSQWMK